MIEVRIEHCLLAAAHGPQRASRGFAGVLGALHRHERPAVTAAVEAVLPAELAAVTVETASFAVYGALLAGGAR